LGRPDLEIAGERDALYRQLKKSLPENYEIPPVEAALIFTHPDVVIESEDAPSPALYAKKAKDFFRRISKEKPISEPDSQTIKGALEK
jgi:hypothetical protein